MSFRWTPRISARAAAAAAGALALLAAQAATASTASAASGLVYKNVASGKCLDVAGTAAGSCVMQFPCHGGTHQQWLPDNGRLKNVETGQCLAIDAGSGEWGAKLIIWPCNDHWAQKWADQHTGKWFGGRSTFKIENPNSDPQHQVMRVVDVPGGTTNNVQMIAWGWYGGTNQQWTIHNPSEF
ncbi:RICIN domain-containing protein [Streptomyces sp. NPDC048604]|uniref:RICIN domain-containing protein n=1 Tax=Streptomyces sp. NPDC048604 TaxID=3365578 RepID=UPI00371E850F